jgi:hypothetical protein
LEADIFTASSSVILQKLRYAVANVNPDQFLQILPTVDQEEYKHTIPPLDRGQPKFYWIFKNEDFQPWGLASHYMLWVCGPPDCSIDQASSHLLDLARNEALEQQHCILKFFCSTAATEDSIITVFICTLFFQFVSCSPLDKHKSAVKIFLEGLLEGAHKWRLGHFKGEDPQLIAVEEIVLKAPTDELWSALESVLADEQERSLTIIIDGLDKIENHQGEFIRGIRALVEHLQKKISKVKALFTSQPQDEIRQALDKLPYIEYNKERKGSLTPLNPEYSPTNICRVP